MASKFGLLFDINKGPVLLKLADTVLILINTGPCNVKECTVPVQCMLGYDTTARLKFDFESHAQGQC